MPAEPKPARWKVTLAWGAFALFAFLLCLSLTFPYDALRARLVTEAAAQGYALRIGTLRPGLHGITATDVRVSKPPAPLTAETLAALTTPGALVPGPEELGEPLHIDALAFRPSLFPLGVAFWADALGGTVSGAVGPLGGLTLRVRLDGLDTSKGNLKGFSGMDLEGTLDGHLDLSAPAAEGAGQAGPDFSRAEGEVALDTRGLTIKGGKVKVPMYGSMMPVDLPRIALGELALRLPIEKGQGTLETLRGRSEDLEVAGSGTLKLARRLEYSEPNLELKLKAEPAFTQRLGILGSGLSILPADRQDPTFRVARLTGYLGRPNFGPGAR